MNYKTIILRRVIIAGRKYMEGNSKIKLSFLYFAIGLSLLILPACQGQTQQTPIASPKAGENVARTTKVVGDGNLSSPFQRSIAFATSGLLKEINVKEGDSVTSGQVLARLDGATEEQAVMKAEIAVNNADIAVRTAEIELELANNTYRKITYPYTYFTFAFAVPDSLAAISKAQAEIDNIQEVMGGSTSQAQVSEVLDSLKKVEDSLTAAREKLGRGEGPDLFLSGQLSTADFWTLREAQLAVDRARLNVDRNRSLLDEAQRNLEWARREQEKTAIIAPFDGVVVSIGAKAGEFLSPVTFAGKTIVELIDLRHLELNARVDELDIPRVKNGQKATINIDALPGTKFEGKVSFISPVASERVGVVMYTVKIEFDVPEGSPVRAGMSANAEIVE
jgi:HlyD family secretion protein